MDEEVEKLMRLLKASPMDSLRTVAELGGVSEGEEAEVTIDFKELAEALKELREGV